jgi:hypothetical protein
MTSKVYLPPSPQDEKHETTLASERGRLRVSQGTDLDDGCTHEI